MSLVWGGAWLRRHRQKLVWLLIGGGIWASAVAGCDSVQQQQRRAAEQDESSSVGWDSSSLWRQSTLSSLFSSNKRSPRIIGIALDDSTHEIRADVARKIIRTAFLEIEVKDPSAGLEQVHAIADHVDGYLMSSQMNGGPDVPAGAIVLRVPVARFDEALSEIKKLADRVESEKIEATDVTQNYVDREAALRNLRAEETQYLLIMKRARSVTETLEVSSKLSGVRGQIEQQQSEFLSLSKQIETVAISVSLVPTAETQVFGIHWRPLYSVKVAARRGMDGLASFVGTFTGIIFLLPTILLWLAFIIISVAIVVRIFRWIGKKFFVFPNPTSAQASTAQVRGN